MWRRLQSQFSYWMNGYITSSTIGVGVFLNAVCLLAFYQPRLRRSRERPIIYSYLMIMLVWDTVLLIPGAFFMYSFPTIYFGRLTYFAGQYSYVFPYAYYFSSVTMIGSTWAMLAVTADRYYAICHPLRQFKWVRKRTIWIILSLLTFSSFVFCLPELFKLAVHKCWQQNSHSATLYIYQENWASDKLYLVYYRVIGGMIFDSIIPYLLLIMLTSIIVYKMKRNAVFRVTKKVEDPTPSEALTITRKLTNIMSLRRNPQFSTSIEVQDTACQRTQPSGERRHRQRLFVVFVIKFILCRILCVVLDILEQVDSAVFHSSHLVTLIIDCSNFLVVLGAASNFFVYRFCSEQFRVALHELIYGRLSTERGGPEDNHQAALMGHTTRCPSMSSNAKRTHNNVLLAKTSATTANSLSRENTTGRTKLMVTEKTKNGELGHLVLQNEGALKSNRGPMSLRKYGASNDSIVHARVEHEMNILHCEYRIV